MVPLGNLLAKIQDVTANGNKKNVTKSQFYLFSLVPRIEANYKMPRNIKKKNRRTKTIDKKYGVQ